MILVPKRASYKEILERYEEKNEFSFKSSKVLPKEQMGEIERVFKFNGSKDILIDESKEIRLKEEVARKIVEKMQDKRLKEKGKINSFIYSTGGSFSTNDKNEEEELKKTGSKIAYVVMELNGLVFMEAVGQFGNATFIAEKSNELENNIIRMGRGESVKKGIVYKVIHDGYDGKTYNYDSNHIERLLEYGISNPQKLIKILKENKGSYTLSTLTKKMSSKEKEYEEEER